MDTTTAGGAPPGTAGAVAREPVARARLFGVGPHVCADHLLCRSDARHEHLDRRVFAEVVEVLVHRAPTDSGVRRRPRAGTRAQSAEALATVVAWLETKHWMWRGSRPPMRPWPRQWGAPRR